MNGTSPRTAAEGAPPSGHHTFVQALTSPLDADGVTAALVGTALFALATVVLFLERHRLADRGDGWWPWVGVVGTLLGVIGWLYCRRRAAREH